MAVVLVHYKVVKSVSISITKIQLFPEKLILLEHLSHCIDTLLFLLHVGMDIEVESCADVGMTEEYADGLVVAFTLDAAGSEAMAKTVKTHFGKSKFLLEFIEVRPVRSRFCRCGRICEYVIFSAHNFLERADQ